MTVAVVLPSGVGSIAFSACVLSGGSELALHISRPKPFHDLDRFHRKWLVLGGAGRMEKYYSKFSRGV